MTETVTHSYKEQFGIFTDFIEWIMVQQILFETGIEATDGTLFEHNTVEYGLTRGVIGEAQEALEELKDLLALEILTPDQEEIIAATREKLHLELVDVLIFLSSVFVHAGMTPNDVIRLTAHKVDKNRKKYAPEHFRNRTIKEGIEFSRDKAAGLLPDQRIERRRANGHPVPGDRIELGESQEYEDYSSYSGSLT